MSGEVKKFTNIIMATNVSRAIDEAISRHGVLTTDHVRALTILVEEVGELAKDVLTMTRMAESPNTRKEALRLAINEASQVAAVAVLMIANLEREGR